MPEILRFPYDDGFLFNHVWGKTLIDGDNNVFGIKRCYPIINININININIIIIIIIIIIIRFPFACVDLVFIFKIHNLFSRCLGPDLLIILYINEDVK